MEGPRRIHHRSLERFGVVRSLTKIIKRVEAHYGGETKTEGTIVRLHVDLSISQTLCRYRHRGPLSDNRTTNTTVRTDEETLFIVSVSYNTQPLSYRALSEVIFSTGNTLLYTRVSRFAIFSFYYLFVVM